MVPDAILAPASQRFPGQYWCIRYGDNICCEYPVLDAALTLGERIQPCSCELCHVAYLTGSKLSLFLLKRLFKI